MGLKYVNLDEQTRKFMVEELERDIAQGSLYISPRLNETGSPIWASVLKQAIENQNDDWLADKIRRENHMKSHEERRTPSGGITMAKVPVTAPDTLAEGEFNRFYARGLCARAIANSIQDVVVYRGKEVRQPRAESEAMIGKKINAKALLDDLRRSHGVEPALGLPPGPNSGLTVCLS